MKDEKADGLLPQEAPEKRPGPRNAMQRFYEKFRRIPLKYIDIFIGACLVALAAVVVLLNPFSEAGALWMFTAIALIIQAMVDLSSTIFSRQGK